jgi:FeS assembly SUF system regulator
MFRLNKMTDYGLMLMTFVGALPQPSLHTAQELAAETQLPLATVGKILRQLLDHELLVSHRGVKGGYALARPADAISVAEIIAALEGPIGFTECSSQPGCCEFERSCSVRDNSRVISMALQRALDTISLSDLSKPLRMGTTADKRRNVVSISLQSGTVQ